MSVPWMVWAAADGHGVREAPRQFGDLITGELSGLPLDAPTIMSAIIIVAFVLQFYWTLITLSLADASSSVATTTTATTTLSTTAASSSVMTPLIIRTQTVTPAPPPEWRHVLRDYELPHWVVKRRAIALKRSGVKYLQQHNSLNEQSPIPPDKPQDVGRVWQARPRMSLHYKSDSGRDSWHVREPLPKLSSHRLVELTEQVEEVRETGVAANMLHAAERWGDHLQQWKILSSDSAHLLRQTLLMMRCAVVSVDFCAELDHYFRRQHDLNLAAAMMNYHDDIDNINQWLPEANETSLTATQGPGRLYGIQATATTEKDKGGAQQRRSQEQEGDRRVWASGSVSNKSWNIYVFMSVMAVLVFLMDSSYRILRVVSTSGRGVTDPHHQVLTTLAAAIRRWDHQNDYTED